MMVVVGIVCFIVGVGLCAVSGGLLVRDYVRRKREDKKAIDEVGGYLNDLHKQREQKRRQDEVLKALEDAPLNHVCPYSSGGALTIEPGKKKPGPKPGVKRLGMKDCMPKRGRGKKKKTEEEKNGK